MKKMTRLVIGFAAVLATVSLQAAVSTWNGNTSAFWTNAANWSPGIPADGDNVVIADTTGSANTLHLTDSRIIRHFQLGATGTRIVTFQILNTVAANSLTITNGFTATGNLPT